MGNKVTTEASERSSSRSVFRVLLLALLLTIVSVLALLTIGYFIASKPVSYLPELNSDNFRKHQKSSYSIEIKNPSYTLLTDDQGGIEVTTPEGEAIMSGLKYFASYADTVEKHIMDVTSVEATSDSTILIAGEGASGVLINLELTVPKDKPKLDIRIKTLYRENTIVRRETLIAGFDVSVSEVYLKNRKVDVGSFESEYWLQRQGVRFGSGDRSALIYHTPLVSSLQLDTKKNILFINLEYYLDHPYLNIPYQKDAGGKWLDLSAANYAAGTERQNKFSIYFGCIPRSIPRIMLVPGGFLSGYVFTEHADGGDIRKHRAAYFGSEDISNAKDATGGFVRYKIPVTKSVFFDDFTVAKDSSKQDGQARAQFLNFLDQLNNTGNYDICLHGMDANKDKMEETFEFMKKRFNTTTWIDHGMFGGAINRQSFVCDGLNPGSVHYTADLWDKYGIRYFWNTAPELVRNYSLMENLKKFRFYDVSVNLWKRYLTAEELKKMRFGHAFREMIRRYLDKGELNSLLPYKGNAFPTPLFWKHPSRTNDFYSWVTDYVQIFKRSPNEISVKQRLLRNLISGWGIFISHGYMVRNLPADGYLNLQNGKLVVNPYFDEILKIMARMRDDGDLYITTVRDLLNYWILTDNIAFEYKPDGIIVKNQNNESIKGFSLVVKADSVLVDGEIPKQRKVDGNLIFWFDINAGQTVRIKVK